jgi:hypothetical protein
VAAIPARTQVSGWLARIGTRSGSPAGVATAATAAWTAALSRCRQHIGPELPESARAYRAALTAAARRTAAFPARDVGSARAGEAGRQEAGAATPARARKVASDQRPQADPSLSPRATHPPPESPAGAPEPPCSLAPAFCALTTRLQAPV